MQPVLKTAILAARRAGNIITQAVSHGDNFQIESKGFNDFVTEVDKKAEQSIIHTLRQVYPDYSILAEESGKQDGVQDCCWIIDPLDGTTNFIHGYPQFAVSIALRCRGKLEHAVIYDPMRQELFSASRGEGALLNDRRIRVSNERRLTNSLLGTGFPFRDMRWLDDYLDTFKTFVPRCSGIRRAGSAALDLAHVAAGRFDGFWEFDLSSWDIAAGVLLVQEAGGMVTDLAGGDKYLDSGHILAGNMRIHKQMLGLIQETLKTPPR